AVLTAPLCSPYKKPEALFGSDRAYKNCWCRMPTVFLQLNPADSRNLRGLRKPCFPNPGQGYSTSLDYLNQHHSIHLVGMQERDYPRHHLSPAEIRSVHHC